MNSVNTVYGNYIDYYNLVSKAEWLYDNEKHEDAEALFVKAFEQVEIAKTKDVWIYCLILNKRKANTEIYKVLKNHLKNIGGTDKKISPYLKKEGIILKDCQFNKLDKIRIDTTLKSYSLSIAQLKIIDSLHNQDQFIRQAFNKGEATVEEVGVVDSSNALMLLKLFKEDNLIQNKRLDQKFYRILLHMRLKYFNMLDPFLLEMIKIGTLDPWQYARAWDRSHAVDGQCLKYFSYTFDSKDLNCLSYDEILKNRQEIGLSIYYSRPSYRFYVPIYKMMKIPLKEYYDNIINGKSVL